LLFKQHGAGRENDSCVRLFIGNMGYVYPNSASLQSAWLSHCQYNILTRNI